VGRCGAAETGWGVGCRVVSPDNTGCAGGPSGFGYWTKSVKKQTHGRLGVGGETGSPWRPPRSGLLVRKENIWGRRGEAQAGVSGRSENIDADLASGWYRK